MARHRLRRLAVQNGVPVDAHILAALEQLADRWQTAANIQVVMDSVVVAAFGLGFSRGVDSASNERSP